MDPLTPDGNLTLVDDVGSSTGAGKQFVTFVTKSGNYFYLVIDRDDKGEETVHFLNLVDESDLLALMEDEEAAAYKEAHTVVEPEPTATTTPAPEPEPADGPEPAQEQEESKLNPILLLLPLALAGGGAGYYLMQKKKKQAEKQKPDPDADYSEDEGVDYGYGDAEDATDDPLLDEEADDAASFDEEEF